MALVRFGGGVSEIRGSIAGNVFSRSRSGAIIRNRTSPIQPDTTYQSNVRAFMQQATDGFRALTPEEVNLWADTAQSLTRLNGLGESYVPSGKQLFTETFINNLIIGEPSPDLSKIVANPNLPDVQGPTAITVEQTAGALTKMEFTGIASNWGTDLVIQATMPIQSSVRNYKKELRQVAISPLTDTPGDDDFFAAYLNRFPLTDWADYVGMQIGFRFRAVNSGTGLSSAWIYASGVVATDS